MRNRNCQIWTKEDKMKMSDNTPKMLTFEEATDEPFADLEKANEDRVGPYMDEILDAVYEELEDRVGAVLEKGIDLEKFEKWKDGCDMTKKEYVEMEHKIFSKCEVEDLFDYHRENILARDAWERDMDATYDSMIRQWNAGTF